MPEPDWTTMIGAVASVIAAITGVITVTTSGLRARREAKRVAASRWTIQLREVKPGFLEIGLRYAVTDAPSITLRSLRIRSPRGLRFCDYRSELDEAGPMKQRTLRIGGVRLRKTHFNMDIGGHAESRDAIRTIVELPRRPFWTRSRWMRIRIAVRAEEQAAARRRIAVTVVGPEMQWRSEKERTSEA